MVLFNPKLSPATLGVVKPIMYVGEAIILFGSLFLINSINMGESDLGIWGGAIFAVILVFVGVLFFFLSGFVPQYLGPYKR